jgi:hypothetical protein
MDSWPRRKEQLRRRLGFKNTHVRVSPVDFLVIRILENESREGVSSLRIIRFFRSCKPMSCRPGLRSRLVLSWCADLVLTSSSEAKQRPFSEHQCRFPRSINTVARERHSVRSSWSSPALCTEARHRYGLQVCFNGSPRLTVTPLQRTKRSL